MADTTSAAKTPANPDKLLGWAELVKKLTGQADQIAKAAESVATIARDKEGKEIKPPTDVAGLARLTAMALRSDYAAQMKEYGGSPDLAIEICTDATVLRRKMAECAILARALQEKVKDADTNLDTLASFYAQANAPKLQIRIAKEEAAAKKVQERIEKLKKAAAGAGRKKVSA